MSPQKQWWLVTDGAAGASGHDHFAPGDANPALTLIGMLLLLGGISGVAFEIAALIWLRRNSASLPLRDG